MKLKLDENLPESLLATLKGLGHDVDNVTAEGLAGQADPDVWEAAQKAERFLITQDLDFSDIRKFSPGTHQGLMLVRLRVPGRSALSDRITAVFHDSVPVTHRHQFVSLAISRRDGSVLWWKVLREEWPHEGGHVTGGLASNSPVTDGEHIYVFFGSRGLYCLDLTGELKWSKDLGRMHTLHAHGEGSSPVLYGDRLIVCWDHEADSYLYAFDVGCWVLDVIHWFRGSSIPNRPQSVGSSSMASHE
jgi:hypothetical protein